MSSSAIVQKLWNYCNVLPACRALLGAGRRDNLSAWDLLARRAQASGDYPSARLRTGVEQLTYLLFLKMADEGLTLSVSFRTHRFSSLCKCAIMRASEVCHG